MMRVLTFVVLSLLWTASAVAQVSLGPGVSFQGAGSSVTPGGGAAASTVSILDYGAKCDGTTDDTGALNSAFQAARSSPIYQNGGVVHIIGAANVTNSACRVTSVNATGFTKIFTTNQLEVSDLSLICAGSGNICLDFTGSVYYHLRNVEVIGDTTFPPEIGIQIGGITEGLTACCISTLSQVQTGGSFTLAALYNLSAESMTFYGNRYRNSGTTTGPIRYFDTNTPDPTVACDGITKNVINGGSGYTDEHYNRVPLHGGNGHGAIAKVIVCGGAVTTVDVGDATNTDCPSCYQGRDYQVGDVLTIDPADIGGTGSGAFVTVVSVASYGVIMDGLNYWHATSQYQTITNPVGAFLSFTFNSWFGGAVNYSGDTNILGAALWVTGPRSLVMDNVYLLTFNAPTWCVELNDSAVNIDQKWRIGCEVGSTVHSVFHITGPNNGPEMVSLNVDSAADMGNARYLFSISPYVAVGSVTLRNFRAVMTIANNMTFFDQPQKYVVSGNAEINRSEIFNMPKSFSGSICTGGPSDATTIAQTDNLGVCAVPNGVMPNLGPLEYENSALDRTDRLNPVLIGAVAAYSCSRRLTAYYAGPLCQIERTNADTTVTDIDIYPNGLGDFDANAAAAFCAGVTCRVHTMYDQTVTLRTMLDPTATANDAVQATPANQPELVLHDSQIANHTSVYFGTGNSDLRLTVTASATIADIFSANSGGYLNVFVSRVGSGNPVRVLSKISGNIGWDFRNSTNGDGKLGFVKGASTTNGDWEGNTAVNFNHGVIYELQYSAASVTNVPTITTNGILNTLKPGSQQPVGTFGSDAAVDLTVGNYPGLTRGMDGALAEAMIYNTNPSSLRRNAIRRNQAVYYGIGTSLP